MSICLLIEAHRAAFDAFSVLCGTQDQLSEFFDSSDSAKQRYEDADAAEEKAMLELCAYPVKTVADRSKKSAYLVNFEIRNELTQEQRITLLTSEQANLPFQELDLSHLGIEELETLHDDMKCIADHLEAAWQLKPCIVQVPGRLGVDLTPIGLEIEKIEKYFYTQMFRTVDAMSELKPGNNYLAEIRELFLLKNAVNSGKTVQEIAALANSLAKQAVQS